MHNLQLGGGSLARDSWNMALQKSAPQLLCVSEHARLAVHASNETRAHSLFPAIECMPMQPQHTCMWVSNAWHNQVVACPNCSQINTRWNLPSPNACESIFCTSCAHTNLDIMISRGSEGSGKSNPTSTMRIHLQSQRKASARLGVVCATCLAHLLATTNTKQFVSFCALRSYAARPAARRR